MVRLALDSVFYFGDCKSRLGYLYHDLTVSVMWLSVNKCVMTRAKNDSRE